MYNKKFVFSSAFIGMLLFGRGLITLGAVAPELKEKFHLDEIDAGTLFSILPIGILAGSLLFGPIADRQGYKWLMIMACMAMCLGFEGIPYAPSLFLLKVAVFIFGIGGGILNGATNAMVADISADAKGANLSLLGVFFGLGALGMPFILGLLKGSVAAHQVVAIVGWLTLALGVLYVFIQFPSSKRAQGFVQTKKTLYSSAKFSAVTPITSTPYIFSIRGFMKRHPKLLSYICASLPNALVLLEITYGPLVMCSTPPAIRISPSPF
jgi:MFS family permease